MMLQSRQQLPPNPEQFLAEFIPYLEGADKARCLAIASFTLVIYEYFLTVDDEVSSFKLFDEC
jgi:hypothetical protein